MRPRLSTVPALVVIALFMRSPVLYADEWHVATGASGRGTAEAPFGSIQEALDVAQPGDRIAIRPGTYHETVRTIRSGSPGEPITLIADGTRGDVVVTAAGRVLTIRHPYITVEGLVFDGQYGLSDTIKVETGGSHLTFRNNEVRRSSRDLIDLSGPQAVTIDGCLIHHALNAANGRTDAHGIVAGPVQQLTIHNTEIHTFSGDGVQVDPGRSAPGWSSVEVDSVRIWLEPLEDATNGFAAGIVPGENAIDTKASADWPRASLTLRNVTASGFRGGLIGNMAAFNLKEHISATLDGITVFDSEIAFRLRGGGEGDAGAWVTIMNAVVHDVAIGFRYEDDIRNLRIWNSTIGADVPRAFRAASSDMNGIEVRNLLMLGARPVEAAHSSNLVINADSFVDVDRHDYRLTPDSPAVDVGVALPAVSTDRDGTHRPNGSGLDVGAYELRTKN
jgi:hypothetical protein